MIKDVKNHLETKIIPFWNKMIDRENGGFYGEVDENLNILKEAEKGGIATARFLWTYSRLANHYGDPIYKEYADHIYDFLVTKVLDNDKGGIYWLVDYKGNPSEPTKHVYAQSFAVYGLSEYYKLTGKEEALKYAMDLFNIIETTGFDQENQAYLEEFDVNWNPQSNDKLSELEVVASITQNTHLHILEGYTTLLEVTSDERVKKALIKLIDTFYNKIYNADLKCFNVFFDSKWNSIIDTESYGHDIEATWLLDAAMDVVLSVDSDEELVSKYKKYKKMNIDVAASVKEKAFKDSSLIAERVNDKINPQRIWWAQAESMVGFYNQYQKTNDVEYLKIVEEFWKYINEVIVDHRDGGEWHWDERHNYEKVDNYIAGPWKTNYHNVRACLELIERSK